jgi:hypothetical protein
MENRETFKSRTEEFHHHLSQAEQHARKAHDMLYSGGGPQRSLWYRMTLGRAQSILMSLWTQELRRKEVNEGDDGNDDDGERSEEVPHSHSPT